VLSPFKWLKRLIVLFLIVAGGGYAFAEVKARGFTEEKIEAEASAVAPAANPQATVSFPLVWTLITKSEVQTVEVILTGYDLGPFLADRVFAFFNGIHVEKVATLRERELVLSSIDSLDLIVEVSAAEVSRALTGGLSFEFAADSALLKGPGLEIAGTLRSESAGRIFFEPSTALPKGVAVPDFEVSMPFVDCLQRVVVKPGLLEIACHINNPPADFRP